MRLRIMDDNQDHDLDPHGAPLAHRGSGVDHLTYFTWTLGGEVNPESALRPTLGANLSAKKGSDEASGLVSRHVERVGLSGPLNH